MRWSCQFFEFLPRPGILHQVVSYIFHCLIFLHTHSREFWKIHIINASFRSSVRLAINNQSDALHPDNDITSPWLQIGAKHSDKRLTLRFEVGVLDGLVSPIIANIDADMKNIETAYTDMTFYGYKVVQTEIDRRHRHGHNGLLPRQ